MYTNNRRNLKIFPEELRNKTNLGNQDAPDIRKYPFLYLNQHPANFHLQKTKPSQQSQDCYSIGSNNNRILKNMSEADDILTNVFFSDENKEYLQQKIREEVLRIKNFGIGRQSDQRLAVVMESIFHEYARHLPYDIKGQIAELDQYVIENVVPDVISNVEQRIGYIRDINKPLEPIGLPKNVSAKGTRTLPSVSRFFPN